MMRFLKSFFFSIYQEMIVVLHVALDRSVHVTDHESVEEPGRRGRGEGEGVLDPCLNIEVMPRA